MGRNPSNIQGCSASASRPKKHGLGLVGCGLGLVGFGLGLVGFGLKPQGLSRPTAETDVELENGQLMILASVNANFMLVLRHIHCPLDRARSFRARIRI